MQKRGITGQRAFGQAIREIRKAAGMTQEQLAERSGMDATYIGRVERGQINVTLETQERIACALKLRLSELLLKAEL